MYIICILIISQFLISTKYARKVLIMAKLTLFSSSIYQNQGAAMFLLLRLDFIILCGRSASLFAISCNSRCPCNCQQDKQHACLCRCRSIRRFSCRAVAGIICTASIRRSGIGIDRFQRVDGCLHLFGQLIHLFLRHFLIFDHH